MPLSARFTMQFPQLHKQIQSRPTPEVWQLVQVVPVNALVTDTGELLIADAGEILTAD